MKKIALEEVALEDLVTLVCSEFASFISKNNMNGELSIYSYLKSNWNRRRKISEKILENIENREYRKRYEEK